MSAPLLEVRELAVHRGRTPVLDIPSLRVGPGEVLALIGPNGAGKSTLLLTLAALLKPSAGTLAFHGEVLDSEPKRQAYRRRVTMVFQDPLLFDTTVRENIAAGLRLHGVAAEERLQRVEATAAQFGIAGLLDRSARQLSGGEAQRTALARAFALRPELLLLDEPFSALDPPTRGGLLEDLGRILADTGTSALLATHDQAEASRLANRLAVMKGGRILQAGALQQVMNHPEDPFVATFVGMETLLQCTVTAAVEGVLTLALGGHELIAVGEAEVGDPILVGIRPEHVTLSLHTDKTSSARNQLAGTVTKVIPWGPFHRVELDCGFDLSTWVTPQSLTELALAPGRPVVAAFKATAVHVVRKGHHGGEAAQT